MTKLLGNRRDTVRLIDNVGEILAEDKPESTIVQNFRVMIPMQHEKSAYTKRDSDILQKIRD